ncbi:hypothetical protein Slash_64 [Bacillus phage Slash]|uniref:Uncharacterized protein n=2 Tax=Slashvirus TaxID=1921709 RepID=U5PXV8_9CAUD|nr:hypothetical protein Staley_66 [Bacillus phage Staley]YP_008771966.1 hypothetical protein Slash_64 [Bacillus phage Slash]AGY48353.1 hypothetical protein Slash_64 [Bacillus phage Slash]AGY48749.1 hypothetical protein Staley_66 [Bacillus phage Staley]
MAWSMNDYEVGNEVKYTDEEMRVYYHGVITHFENGRIHFDVYKKFHLETDELIRDFKDNPIKGSVGEVTLYRFDFIHGKPNPLEVELNKRQRTILQSLFFDLAQDTKDDQWLESLKSEAWKNELLEA